MSEQEAIEAAVEASLRAISQEEAMSILNMVREGNGS